MEYLSCVWFVDGDPDWLGCLYRAKDDHRWHFDYRFRYHAGSRDPFDGTDRKSWYESTDQAGRTEAEQISDIEMIVAIVAAKNGRPIDRVEVKGAPVLLLEKAKGRHWFHLEKRPVV